MKKEFKQYRIRSGQSLIEVLIAFTVSVVIGMALVSAGLATQRASISARNKSQATKLAQEYLEDIRLMRDAQGFSTFFTTYSGSCYKVVVTSGTDPSMWTLTSIADPCTNTSQWEAVPLNNTNFYRKVTFSEVVANISKKVVVDVSWTEGLNTRTVSEETTLSMWCNGSITGTSTADCP